MVKIYLTEIFFFKKVNIDEKFPKFLVDNKDIYKNWIQE